MSAKKEEEARLLNLVIDTDNSRVIMDVRGAFHHPEEAIGKEISQLRELAQMYPLLEIHIRSDGGSVETLVEIIATAKLFTQVITIGYSCIASAGSALWAIGDVRVLAPYSYAMFHRESFGSYGKAEEQLDRVNFVSKVCSEIMEDAYAEILTPEEMEFIKRNELFLTQKELLERDVAITLEEYYERSKLLENASKVLIEVDGELFLVDTLTMNMKQIEEIKLSDEVFSVFPDLYLIQVDNSVDENVENKDNNEIN